MEVAEEWESLKIGSRWRMAGAKKCIGGALEIQGPRSNSFPRALAGIQPYTVTTSLLDFDSNNDFSGALMCFSSS
jgi:hypothetical protein